MSVSAQVSAHGHITAFVVDSMSLMDGRSDLIVQTGKAHVAKTRKMVCSVSWSCVCKGGRNHQAGTLDDEEGKTQTKTVPSRAGARTQILRLLPLTSLTHHITQSFNH